MGDEGAWWGLRVLGGGDEGALWGVRVLGGG